jgi:hypothetical protein
MGVLKVSVEERIRIDAVSATVHVNVTGSSVLTTAASVRTSTEVRELVSTLGDKGVSEEAITIVGVRAETSSGLLAKSQRMNISLQIAAELAQLPAVLSVLTSRPGTRLDYLEWRYDEFEASITAAAAATAKARRKAEALAAASGQRITGIAELSDSWSRHSAPAYLGAERGLSAAKSDPDFSLGFELVGSTELTVHLSVDYQIEDATN